MLAESRYCGLDVAYRFFGAPGYLTLAGKQRGLGQLFFYAQIVESTQLFFQVGEAIDLCR
ncbi:hypothetical protein D3C85_1693960 [compost metagenome]